MKKLVVKMIKAFKTFATNTRTILAQLANDSLSVIRSQRKLSLDELNDFFKWFDKGDRSSSRVVILIVAALIALWGLADIFYGGVYTKLLLSVGGTLVAFVILAMFIERRIGLFWNQVLKITICSFVIINGAFIIAFLKDDSFIYVSGVSLLIMGMGGLVTWRVDSFLVMSIISILGSLFTYHLIGLQGKSLFLNIFSVINSFFISGACVYFRFALIRKEYFSSKKREKEVERRYEAELSLVAMEQETAGAIQAAMLPANVVHSNLDIFASYRPAQHLGGDFYSYRASKCSRYVYFFLGDVTGHGPASALLTGVALGAMEAEVSDENDPERTLTETVNTLNRIVCSMEKKTGRYMTLIAAAIDACTGEIMIINAGHVHPIVLDSKTGKAKNLTAKGNPLGFSPVCQYEVKKSTLSDGDLVFLTTDGLTDPTSTRNEIRKRDLLAVISDSKSAGELHLKVDGLVGGLSKPAEDDIAYIAVGVKSLSAFFPCMADAANQDG